MRYDELYQETIRRLEDAIRSNPSAVKPRVQLAQYLDDEAKLRGEEVEPRRGFKPFRWQFSQESELNRALKYVNDALRIDPKSVAAMVTKANVLTGLGRDADAESLADQATKLAGPSNPEATRLLAMFRRRQISRMLTTAGSLRSPRFSINTEFEHRYDGVWEITHITRHDPSPADLARAAAIQNDARKLINETKQLMQSAIEVSRGTLDGLLLESAYEDWMGSGPKGLKLLQEAVQKYPNSVKASDALINYYRYHPQRDIRQYQEWRDAVPRQEAIGWQLFQTTCAPLLRLVWNDVRQQGWPALLKDLQRARQLDPIDTRATAYLRLLNGNCAIRRSRSLFSKSALRSSRLGSISTTKASAGSGRDEPRTWPTPCNFIRTWRRRSLSQAMSRMHSLTTSHPRTWRRVSLRMAWPQ